MALQRTLEPEVMDTEQDAREYDEMSNSAANTLFVDDLLKFARSVHDDQDSDQEFELGDVLDLGTGTALIPVELCKRHEGCRVMAVDLAASMLDLAVYNLEVSSLTHRVTLTQVDAKDPGFEDSMFDVAMSNSIVHHLAEPLGSLEHMSRVTSEGGILFVRDLMRPDDLETLESLVETYMADDSEYCRKLYGESLHAALNLDEIREIVSSLGFDPQSVQATSDRHWTWATQNSPAV